MILKNHKGFKVDRPKFDSGTGTAPIFFIFDNPLFF
jgi:hypothetical protein